MDLSRGGEMSHYLTWEEEEAHRKGERDASYGRHRDYEYDCHLGEDVDRAYCEGYAEEERRQERLEEERREEEREREKQERREHERYMYEQQEAEMLQEQQYWEQMEYEQTQQEYPEPPIEEEENGK